MKHNIFLYTIVLMTSGCLYPYSDRANDLLLIDEDRRIEQEKQILLYQENEKAKRKNPATVSGQ